MSGVSQSKICKVPLGSERVKIGANEGTPPAHKSRLVFKQRKKEDSGLNSTIFKKYNESDRGNYRPFSMLSIPSKILESCVTDSIVDRVFPRNQLVTKYQWAYRKGHRTDSLLAHLTETWRRALDSNLVVGELFIDFQKTFDNYGIKGSLLDWARDYE